MNKYKIEFEKKVILTLDITAESEALARAQAIVRIEKDDYTTYDMDVQPFEFKAIYDVTNTEDAFSE